MKRLILLILGLGPVLSVAQPCVELSQPLQQGSYVWGKLAPGSTATLDGESLVVLADGTVFLGFGRDAAPSAVLEIHGPGECRQELSVAGRDYDISRIEGVPQRTVTPSEEHLDRIRREGQIVRSAKDQRLQRPDLAQAVAAGFEWPLTGRISGVYGSQRIYNGTPRAPHYGVDVARPTGTPVRAPAPGVVTLAQPDLFYSGGTIILDHGYGLSSSFLHLSKVEVKVGDEITTGDLLGEVGATGRATGPHLDWRMSWRDRRIDPQLLVPAMPTE